MNHGSLFSGIGGFDLAASWMNWENIFHCEWNPFGQKVLKHHFPQSISYNDITKTDFSIHRGEIDILTGGFPCQPYSLAGKRKGKEDERHLWPEMLRAIREIQPSWVVGENVFGLINWSGGLVFDEVQADLEAAGYEVFPYVLPACAVNAPHRRDRVWFVAYNQHNGNRRREQQQESEQKTNRASENTGSTGGKERLFTCEALQNDTHPNGNGFNGSNGEYEVNASEGRINAFSNINESNGNGNVADTLPIRLQQCENGEEVGGRQGEMGRERSESTNAIETNGEIRNATDTNGNGFNRSNGKHEVKSSKRGFDALNDFNEATRHTNGSISQGEYIGQKREGEFNGSDSRDGFNNFKNFPTQSPICGGNDGLPTKLDGITFSKWRNESIKAFGNAIVPQVAYQIFKAIEQWN